MVQGVKRLELIVGLISDDLKIHTHLHILSASGFDTSLLQLKIHDRIFLLAGIDENRIDDTLRDWYYEMAEKAFAFDVFRDEKQLIQLATTILLELNKIQFSLE